MEHIHRLAVPPQFRFRFIPETAGQKPAALWNGFAAAPARARFFRQILQQTDF